MCIFMSCVLLMRRDIYIYIYIYTYEFVPHSLSLSFSLYTHIYMRLIKINTVKSKLTKLSDDFHLPETKLSN